MIKNVKFISLFINSKFVMIEKAEHLIWLDQPKIFTEQIELFLKE